MRLQPTLCLSKVKWLHRYLHTEVHKVFFSSFPCELADSEPTWKHDNPIVWTLELVKCLKRSDYKVVRVFGYSIDIILGSFITKFVINSSVSYSEAER